jgi:hypothetical protein
MAIAGNYIIASDGKNKVIRASTNLPFPAIRIPKKKDMKHRLAKTARVFSALILNPVGAFKLSILVAGTILVSTAAPAAEVCNPPCPKGQVCAFKDAKGGGGATVCKTPITIECTNDPLCGLKGRKRPGSSLRAN